MCEHGRVRWMGLVALVAGCDRLLGFDQLPPVDSAPPCTSPLTPGDFSSPAVIIAMEFGPTLAADETLMYMAGKGTISYSHFTDTWAAPTPAATLDDPLEFEDRPSLFYNASAIFFTRHMTGGSNVFDLPYEAQRLADQDAWAPATAITFPSALDGNDVVFGVPTAAGDRVVASHGLQSHYHLAELRRSGTTWVLLDTTGALYPSGDVSDSTPQLSPDGCWLVFSRLDNNATNGNHELMFANRGLDGTFGAPEKLMTNPSMFDEQHAWLSPDGATLYFADNGIYVAHRH